MPQDKPSRRPRLRRLSLWALAGLLLVCGGLGYRLQLSLRRQLPAIVRDHLGRVLGRRVEFEAVHAWPPGVFTIDRVRVLPAPDERAPPLRAERARAHIDWLEFLRRRQLRIRSIELIRPQIDAAIDLRPPLPGRPSVNEQVLALAAAGVRSLTIRDGSVTFRATLPGDARQTIRVQGVSGSLDLEARKFAYRVEANSWTQSGQTLTGLQVAGEGDARTTRIARSELAYRGGRVQARASYREPGQQLALNLEVRDMPLAAAARQMGLPGDWDLAGRVSGTVELAAAGGNLRGVRGSVAANGGELKAAGLPREFRWDSATADLEWNQKGIGLRNVRVRGDGIELSGQADVLGRPNELATSGQFSADGKIRVTGRRAVAQLGSLLAHHLAPEGWSAGGAELQVRAAGSTGRLSESLLTGRFTLGELAVRPAGAEAPVSVHRLAGEFRRDASGLQLSGLQVDTPGLTATGAVKMSWPGGTRSAEFAADGTVRISDPASLRRLLPRAAAWRWLATDCPGRGELRFRANGPVSQVAAIRAEGEFTLHGSRMVLPLTRGDRAAPVVLAIERAHGRFRHQGDALQLVDVELAASGQDAFRARGSATVSGLHAADPVVTLNGELRGDRWDLLPGVTPKMTRRLKGGRYAATVALSGPLSRLAEVPVSGRFTLSGARLVWQEASPAVADPERTVETLSATYRREGRTLRLTDVRVEGDGLRVTGEVRIADTLAPDPLVEVTAQARIERWERLAMIPAGLRESLRGGRLVADLRASGPMSALDSSPSSGTFRLEGGTLAWRDGEDRPVSEPVEEFSGSFRRSAANLELGELRLRCPALDLRGSLDLADLARDGRAGDPLVRLTARGSVAGWEKLPGVTARMRELAQGGQLSGELSLSGRLSRLADATLHGELELQGTRVDAAAWNRDREPQPDARDAAVRVNLRAGVRRSGGNLDLERVQVTGEGIDLAGEIHADHLGEESARVRVACRGSASGWERFVKSSPGLDLHGGRLGLDLRGDALAAHPERGAWSGTLTLDGAELGSADPRPAGKPATPVLLRHAATAFRRDPAGWQLTDCRIETDRGTLTGSGMAAADGRPAVRFAGRLTAADSRAALAAFAPGIPIEGGSLEAEFQLAGALDSLPDAQIAGWIGVRDARLRRSPEGGRARLALHRLTTRFRRTDSIVELWDFLAELPSCRVLGAGKVQGLGGSAEPTLRADVELAGDNWQEMLGLDSAGLGGVEGGRLTLQTVVTGPLSTLGMENGNGRFRLEGCQVRMPDSRETLPVTRLVGRFHSDSEGLRLTGVELESPVGHATGSGELLGSGSGATHRFEASWQSDEPVTLLRPFVTLPGTLKGGRLEGTVRLAGGATDTLATVQGDFHLSNARYLPPGHDGASPAPSVRIRSLEGAFENAGGRTRLTRLQLLSPSLTAGGSLEFLPDGEAPGEMIVHTSLELPDLSQLADFWPVLKGHVSGGSARAEITFRGDVSDWSHTTGTGSVEASGGRFIIPDVEARFDQATFSPLKARFSWDDRGVQVQSLSLRGDKYNVDAEGSVLFAGHLDVSGRTWLTRDFGRSLMPRGVTGFLGKLLGIVPKEIDSGFRLVGEIQRPLLTMSITRRSVWKYARRQVDPPIQRIATGRQPLWDLTAVDVRRRVTTLDPNKDIDGDPEE